MFTEIPVQDWQNYLIFNLVDGYAEALSQDFVDAHFQMHKKTLEEVSVNGQSFGRVRLTQQSSEPTHAT